MADAAEAAFIATFARSLSAQPVVYPDDYRQPPENSLRKVPVLPIEVPPAPKRIQETPTASTSGTITLTIKSLKPAHTFTLSCAPSDSIAHLKTLLASQPRAPPADAQRLLLKGKVLADTKLLQEYAVAADTALNLSLKPGSTWDPTAPLAPLNMQTSSPREPSPGSLSPNRISADLPDIEPPPQRSPPIVALTTPPPDLPVGGKPKRGHVRIPSVVLSPSPSGTSPIEDKPADILLTFDTSSIPTASEVAGPPRTTFHNVVSDPAFWTRLNAFLKNEFPRAEDAQEAFENFLNSSKGSLSPHEIAKIRDQVGIIGMAGI